MRNNQTKKGVKFEAECKKYMILRHINSKEQLRSLTTVGSNRTFLKYFKDPDLMPLGVANEIMEALKVPSSERASFIEMLTGGT